MKPLVIEALYGFGDHLFIRPMVLEEAKRREVYIQCGYPELYLDTPVHVIKPTLGQYSFSDKSAESHQGWANLPEEFEFRRIQYTQASLQDGKTISASYGAGFPQVFATRFLPTGLQLEMGRRLIDTERQICLVKMPSYATDWRCESRSPNIDYLIECIKIAREKGYYIVSIKGEHDVFGEPERLQDWVGLCDLHLHRDISIDELIGIFAIAKCVVSYPNFTIPLTISLDKPMFCVYGGHVAPELIVDVRMLPYHYEYVAPDPFCNCVENYHACNKHIEMEVVKGRFHSFLDNLDKPHDGLVWNEEIGYGYYPVDNTGVYNDDYFDKYRGYEQTDFGDRLNSARVELAKRFSDGGEVIDIGIGSGQFVRAMDCKGYDVCEKAINWLKETRRWVDFWVAGAYNASLVTFFDSFEHEANIHGLIENCCGRNVLISIPIFEDKAHVLRSKHFRKDEHYHYFTRDGLVRWFKQHNYDLVYESTIESDLGREGIGTFAFTYTPINE